MWFLAQVVDQVDPALEQIDPHSLWLATLIRVIISAASLPYLAFLVWMLIHCSQNEPDRFFWIWIILVIQPFGAIAYFILRYLPAKEFPAPAFLRKWTRGREILRLETAAEQIGNPHQFVLWGDALREVGSLDRARSAYERALKKEPDNLQALWGAAQIATAQKRYEDVKNLTRKILDKDPQYKFGDVSLAYGRAMNELKDFDTARTHFENHVRRWRHPESLYLLAKLCVIQGDPAAARQNLQGLIQDINGSPYAIARKFGRWKSLARQLLRQLPG